MLRIAGRIAAKEKAEGLVTGEAVGQVNGLAVVSAGPLTYGFPSRITATIGPGISVPICQITIPSAMDAVAATGAAQRQVNPRYHGRFAALISTCSRTSQMASWSAAMGTPT